ncbi:MAG: sigma-54 dependent transcriptional regulator [bacterium]|nr:sigma-54 dependent transcriptional regulator [bacterium]
MTNLLVHPKILVVDDDEDMRFTLREVMTREGYQVVTAADGIEALDKTRESAFDLVILDMKMPRLDGIETLRQLREQDPELTVIMVTAFGTRDLALEAIRLGAYDYFNKPFDLGEIRIVVRRALEKIRLQRELKNLLEKKWETLTFENIVGNSQVMRDIYRQIEQIAESDVTVVIYGESGTGKELVAEAIHKRSKRSEKPFIRMNCVAIPEGLLESELFGHEKGAFTGAYQQRIGKFELANGGTLFLDEIGDMSLTTQAKVLRVLQEREFERVGGTKTIKVDLRFIAATNKDLVTAVKNNTFREDLFYRINVVPLYLPPLRERKEDIPLLLEHFLNIYNQKFNKKVKHVSASVMKILMEREWTGNIREFENVIQRAVVLAQNEVIDIDSLPLGTITFPERPLFSEELLLSQLPMQEKVDRLVAELEKRLILQALATTSGNRTEAAKLLGVSRKGLYDKLEKYGITSP